MKKFLIKVGLFGISTALFCLYVYSKADETTDAFYNRFCQPSKENLIIGSSRAAQGLQPKVFDSILVDKSMFNYAFTVAHSPYGPTYLKSIKKKLSKNTNQGVFILDVNPWSIANDIENPNEIDLFAESNRFLGHLVFVNLDPNIPYLVNHYNDRNFRLLTKNDASLRLHNDGWLEISHLQEPEEMLERRKLKIEQYTKKLQFVSFSETRLKFLSETIQFLKKHGDVYLVRLPAHREMHVIENMLMPEFDEVIVRLSNDLEVPYRSYMNESDNLIFTDGHHLRKDYGKLVSTWIAKWIKNESLNTDVE